MNNNAIEERMSQILNDNNNNSNIIMKSQLNEGGILINNKRKGELKMNQIDVQDINVGIESEVIDEEVITDDAGNNKSIPVIGANINVETGLPVQASPTTNVDVPTTTTKTTTTKKTSKSKKNMINLDEIEKEFIKDFDTMNHEMRFDHLVKMCGETAASSAKKLDLRPANRILESVRGNRLLKDETLNKVYMFYKNHPNLQNRPNVLKLLTPEFFLG